MAIVPRGERKAMRAAATDVCGLDEIDVVVTDSGVDERHQEMLESAGVRIVWA